MLLVFTVFCQVLTVVSQDHRLPIVRDVSLSGSPLWQQSIHHNKGHNWSLRKKFSVIILSSSNIFKIIQFKLSWYSRKPWLDTFVYTIQEANEPNGYKSVSITTLFGDRSGQSWRGNKRNQKIINGLGFGHSPRATPSGALNNRLRFLFRFVREKCSRAKVCLIYTRGWKHFDFFFVFLKSYSDS